MGKFNKPGTKPATFSPVKTGQSPTTRTYQGAAGYERDAKSELFLLAVSNKVGEDTFYEQAKQRDDRYTALVHQVAVDDGDWMVQMIRWLRGTANMRSAALVAAAETVKARKDAGLAGCSRQAVDAALQRADEPGELLAYWTAKYGRAIPQPVKRGIGDAVRRLYSERALLKYDTDSRGFRFGDVLELAHPSPEAGKPWQGDLFRHAIDRRHGRGDDVPESLRVLAARRDLMSLSPAGRREMLATPDVLANAGMTWEALAGWLQGPMDAQAWEAVIPTMGVFALVRNLRNFDEAGVSDEVAEQVSKKIADPQVVARSRMLPFRFWAAYKHAPSLRWAHALEKALGHSLANVPALGGRTLILVDRSPSMFPGFFFSTPNRSDISLAEQAAVFGSALALRAANPTLVEFGGQSRRIDVPKGGSVLRLIQQYKQIDGTDIPSAIKAHFAGHDRVVVVTDEQTRPGWLPSNMVRHGGMRETLIDDLVPRHVPVYMWNMAGYKPGAMPSGGSNRHTFGGLSDAAFGLVPLLEAGRDGAWPWEVAARES